MAKLKARTTECKESMRLLSIAIYFTILCGPFSRGESDDEEEQLGRGKVCVVFMLPKADGYFAWHTVRHGEDQSTVSAVSEGLLMG